MYLLHNISVESESPSSDAFSQSTLRRFKRIMRKANISDDRLDPTETLSSRKHEEKPGKISVT